MTFTQIRLQFLLNLGRKGFHPLFGKELIERAFKRTGDSRLSEDSVVRARLEKGLAQVTLLPTVSEQAEFIASLPASAQSAVCQMYFALVGESAGADKVYH